jgi:opacity protein-like surface antigen
MKSMRPLSFAVLPLLVAAPAFAGNVVPVAPAPVVAAPVVQPTYNWTGGYVGGSLGYAGLNFGVDADEDFGFEDGTLGDEDDDDFDALAGFVDGFDDDGITGGIRLGYDFALANGFVIGGRVDYDLVSFDLDFDDDDAVDGDLDQSFGNSIDAIYRAGVKLGFASGPNMFYGIGGYAGLDADDDSDGYFLGIGGERFVTENVSVGGEILYHEFDEFDVDSLDAEVTTVGLNVNYRF